LEEAQVPDEAEIIFIPRIHPNIESVIQASFINGRLAEEERVAAIANAAVEVARVR